MIMGRILVLSVTFEREYTMIYISQCAITILSNWAETSFRGQTTTYLPNYGFLRNTDLKVFTYLNIYHDRKKAIVYQNSFKIVFWSWLMFRLIKKPFQSLGKGPLSCIDFLKSIWFLHLNITELMHQQTRLNFCSKGD